MIFWMFFVGYWSVLNFTRKCPTWAQHEPNMMPRWAQVDRSWAQVEPRWSQIEPRWGQVGVKLGPSWAKLEPSWAKMHRELSNVNNERLAREGCSFYKILALPGGPINGGGPVVRGIVKLHFSSKTYLKPFVFFLFSWFCWVGAP